MKNELYFFLLLLFCVCLYAIFSPRKVFCAFGDWWWQLSAEFETQGLKPFPQKFNESLPRGLNIHWNACKLRRQIYQFRRQVLAICRISETSGGQLWADLINRCRWRRFHFCQELTHRQHLCSNTLQCQPVHQLNKLIIGNSPYIIQTPVSCRKRKRFTLNNHTVNTVIINKNIMTSRNAVSISLYFFSFSAASFSLTKSLSSFCASTMVENETSKK